MISVIVPVYKVEPYLRQCVDSILEQTYRDIEVLLIDDGSPDKCGEICDEYAEKDNRVRVFHTENRGISAARNLGLKEARGEYIGFVDSDDWIEPDMYETLLKRMQETGADIVMCGVWYEYSNFKKGKISEEMTFIGKDSLRALLEGKIGNYVWNKLYHRSLFRDVYFPEGEKYEDAAIMHEVIGKSQKAVNTKLIGYHYRQRSGSITKEYNAKELIDFADSHLSRYYYFMEYEKDLFNEMQDKLLRYSAEGISKLWRWWYGCKRTDKEKEKKKIEELKQFSREHLRFCGSSSFPIFLRFSCLFMYSSSFISFFLLYYINQLFRLLFPGRRFVWSRYKYYEG